MGLFDFVGDIGKKIFNKEEEASAAVTKHINEDNPGVADVDVKVENGVAIRMAILNTLAKNRG